MWKMIFKVIYLIVKDAKSESPIPLHQFNDLRLRTPHSQSSEWFKRTRFHA